MNPVGDASPAPSINGTRSWWAYVPFGLLGSLSIMLGIMVHLAVSDPGFAVEADYYNKAVNWDQRRSQQAASDQLGWQVQTEMRSEGATPQLIVQLKDGQGRPLSGAVLSVSAFHLARSAHVIELQQFQEHESGVYAADFAPNRSGLWELRVAATISSDTVRKVQRLDLSAASPNLAIGPAHD